MNSGLSTACRTTWAQIVSGGRLIWLESLPMTALVQARPKSGPFNSLLTLHANSKAQNDIIHQHQAGKAARPITHTQTR